MIFIFSAAIFQTIWTPDMIKPSRFLAVFAVAIAAVTLEKRSSLEKFSEMPNAGIYVVLLQCTTKVEVCRNDYCCSHSRTIIPIPIPFQFPVQHLIPIPIFGTTLFPFPSLAMTIFKKYMLRNVAAYEKFMSAKCGAWDKCSPTGKLHLR